MKIIRLTSIAELAATAVGLSFAMPAMADADVQNGILTVTVSSGERQLTAEEAAAIASTSDPLTEVRKKGLGQLTVGAEFSTFKGNVRIAEGTLYVANANPALGPYDENSPGKIVIESSSTTKAKLKLSGCTVDKPIDITPNTFQSPIVCSSSCVFNGRIKLTSVGIAYLSFAGSGETTVFNGGFSAYYETQTVNFSGAQTVYVRGGLTTGTFEFGGGDGKVRFDSEGVNLKAMNIASSGQVHFDRDYCLSSSNTSFAVTAQWGYTYLNGTVQAFGSLGPFTTSNIYALHGGAGNPSTVEFKQTSSATNSLSKFAGRINFRKSGAATFGLNYSGNIGCSGNVEVYDGLFDMGPNCSWSGCTNVFVGGTGVFAFGRTSAFPSSLRIGVEGDGKLAVRDGVAQTCAEFWVDGMKMPAGFYGGEASSAENKLACFSDTDTGVLEVQATVYSWNGGSGSWSDAANWTAEGGSGVPGAGDSVVIASGSVQLPASTPLLYSISVDGGELVFTDWDACLNAQTVHVAPNGVITCVGAFTNAADKCRVLISCKDLTIDAGGKIDVDAKGWSGGLTTVHTTTGSWEGCNGWGPGGGRIRTGASHGGRGGITYISFSNIGTYDDGIDPVEPGSGGYMKSGWLGGDYTDADASHGGGAVKIDATGVVTVNGAVTACGRATRVARGLSAAYCMQTAGSGGSINISCSELAGAGTIYANGGNGDYASFPRAVYSDCNYKHGRPGGGGRIAISYDPAKQTAASVAGLRISAKYGMYASSSPRLTTATIDKTRVSADLGTLHFTDAKLVKALYGKGLCGRVVGYPAATLEFDGDLEYAWGDCRIEKDGFQIAVDGNLTVSGAVSRLEVGALESVFCSVAPGVSAGSVPSSLTVSGNLVVRDGAAVDVRAASAPGQDGWGAHVVVGGDMSILADSYVYAWSDPMSLCAPRFDVGGDFTVAANGFLSANWKGGSGSSDSIPGVTSSSPVWRKGVGPGRGQNAGGGSHGGEGGHSAGESPSAYGKAYVVGAAYDEPFLPSQPGSGGGQSGYGTSGCGGGVIRLAAQGALVVDGTVEADGGIPAYSSDNFAYIDCACAGAGGSIFLSGATFSGTGTLSAKGGNSYYENGAPRYAGAGGGGRIAVWTGVDIWDSTMRRSRILSSSTPTQDGMSFSGVATAAGGSVEPHAGASASASIDEAAAGGDGTVWFCRLKPHGGMTLMLR